MGSLKSLGAGGYPAAMSVRTWLSVLPIAAAIAAGCATYKDDLGRATDHYNKNQFEPALALLRVLEDDVDSFSAADRAQYAYVRGMTDYRLSGLQQQGTGVADPAKGYRINARHWLAIASAIEKNTPGGLTDEEKKHLGDALADLNHDVYGGAESSETDGGAPAAPSATPSAGPAASSAPAASGN